MTTAGSAPGFLQRNGLPSKRKLSPSPKPMPDAVYLDVERAGNDVAGFLGRPPRLGLQFRARRKVRTQHLETTAKIGRQKLFHQAGIACAKRCAGCRRARPRRAPSSLGHVVAEEQADRHAEQLGEGAQIAQRGHRQAALDLADPADRAAQLSPISASVSPRALRSARISLASSRSPLSCSVLTSGCGQSTCSR